MPPYQAPTCEEVPEEGTNRALPTKSANAAVKRKSAHIPPASGPLNSTSSSPDASASDSGYSSRTHATTGSASSSQQPSPVTENATGSVNMADADSTAATVRPKPPKQSSSASASNRQRNQPPNPTMNTAAPPRKKASASASSSPQKAHPGERRSSREKPRGGPPVPPPTCNVPNCTACFPQQPLPHPGYLPPPPPPGRSPLESPWHLPYPFANQQPPSPQYGPIPPNPHAFARAPPPLITQQPMNLEVNRGFPQSAAPNLPVPIPRKRTTAPRPNTYHEGFPGDWMEQTKRPEPHTRPPSANQMQSSLYGPPRPPSRNQYFPPPLRYPTPANAMPQGQPQYPQMPPQRSPNQPEFSMPQNIPRPSDMPFQQQITGLSPSSYQQPPSHQPFSYSHEAPNPHPGRMRRATSPGLVDYEADRMRMPPPPPRNMPQPRELAPPPQQHPSAVGRRRSRTSSAAPLTRRRPSSAYYEVDYDYDSEEEYEPDWEEEKVPKERTRLRPTLVQPKAESYSLSRSASTRKGSDGARIRRASTVESVPRDRIAGKAQDAEEYIQRTNQKGTTNSSNAVQQALDGKQPLVRESGGNRAPSGKAAASQNQSQSQSQSHSRSRNGSSREGSHISRSTRDENLPFTVRPSGDGWEFSGDMSSGMHFRMVQGEDGTKPDLIISQSSGQRRDKKYWTSGPSSVASSRAARGRRESQARETITADHSRQASQSRQRSDLDEARYAA